VVVQGLGFRVLTMHLVSVLFFFFSIFLCGTIGYF
jgi:hypothetical protein